MKGTKLLKQIYIASAVLFCVGITGCRDKVSDIYKGGKEEPEKVPNDFDFSTSSDVQVNIHYDVPKGYKVHFEAYTRNPISLNEEKSYVKDETMIPFIEGWTDGNGDFSYTAEIASMSNEVYVYSSDEGVPTLMKSEIMGDQVIVASETSVISDFASGTSRAVASRANYKKWPKYKYDWIPLGGWDDNGKPDYLLSDETLRYTPTATFNGVVNATRPDNTQLATFFMCTSIDIQEKANVYLNYISHNGSERNNTLAYYTYTNEPTREEALKNLVIAYPNTRASGLNKGDVIQLYYNNNGKLEKDFPIGVKIGFVLLIDAFKASTVTTYSNVMYSANTLNKWNFTDALTASKPGLISYAADGQYVLAFEDQPWNEQAGRNALPDFHDDIFVITANPITSIPAPEPGKDPVLPDYKAIIKTYGILGFEDNWPDKGDYDLNDVTMSYVRTSYVDDFYRTMALDEKYTFINNGATYSNAFGYILDENLSHDAIKSCDVKSSYSCAGQGVDDDIEFPATIMLFDNSKAVPRNTVFEVRTVLKTPMSLYKFNPFIIVNKEKNWLEQDRIEVHLPKYAPTSKGNSSLFNTGDDASSGSNYYVREGNYPFAINLTEVTSDFVVPEEQKAVDVTYPNFKGWVDSNGKNNQDWYLHPVSDK